MKLRHFFLGILALFAVFAIPAMADFVQSTAVTHGSLAAAWHQLGLARERDGDPFAASVAQRRALAVEPSFATAYPALARALVALGAAGEALALLRHGEVHARPAEPVAAARRELEARLAAAGDSVGEEPPLTPGSAPPPPP
jgi:hypothetical protein